MFLPSTMTDQLYAETLTEKLKKQVPTASLNTGAKAPTAGAWYLASRYNTNTGRLTTLTALVGTSGNLYDAVVTVEDARGNVAVVRPTTYKGVVEALKN